MASAANKMDRDAAEPSSAVVERRFAAKPYVVVTGGIAAGKSTLTAQLARALDLPAHLERPYDNPFLSDFGRDAEKWSFASLTWFLLLTLEQQREAAISGGVQEHSSYEGVEVFGRVLRDLGRLEPREHELLGRIAAHGRTGARAPDVVVLLQAPAEALMQRIHDRGREYERGIELGYLEALEARRAAFFRAWHACPVLAVDTTRSDIRSTETVDDVLRRVAAVLEPGGRDA